MPPNLDRFKLRFWDGEKMIYPAEIHYKLVDEERVIHGYRNNFIENYKLVKNSIVMQCLGIRDIEGKLIFEGDIIEYALGENPKLPRVAYEVESKMIFSCGCCETVYGWDTVRDPEDFKIVGNIHENPERFRLKI